MCRLPDPEYVFQIPDEVDPDMPALVDPSESEDEDRYWEAYHDHVESHRGKGIYDSCKSIQEMIGRLEDQIEYLKGKMREGFEVRDEVQDDYADLVPNDIDSRIRETLARQ